jgi:chitinase
MPHVCQLHCCCCCCRPGYINVVIVSFAKPECTYTKRSLSFAGTGLDFSSSGPVVKAGIAALKAATNNNTKVLLAVGGATYTNFAAMNTQCIADLVEDFGFDGVDIDFEVGLLVQGPLAVTIIIQMARNNSQIRKTDRHDPQDRLTKKVLSVGGWQQKISRCCS